MISPRFFAAAVLLACGAAQAQPPLVAIDAGHTLSRQGARAAVDGRAELEFNQALAMAVSRAASADGLRTRMANTPARQDENFKARASAGAGADLFLSIHHDSAKAELLTEVVDARGKRWEDRSGRFKGFALFVDPADKKASACASAIGRRLIQAGERPSLYHADPAMGEARSFVDKEHGTHAFPGLALARLRKAPMVLLEAGVIVEPSESMRLRRPEAIARISSAVAAGVADCLAFAPR